MEQLSHLDVKTIELAGIAASIAGGCRPCLYYHFKKAIEIGCTADQARCFLLFIFCTLPWF